MFDLDKITDREMLIIRMQAFLYSSVAVGKLREAAAHAEEAVRRFDHREDHSMDGAGGYWANFYYRKFTDDCEML